MIFFGYILFFYLFCTKFICLLNLKKMKKLFLILAAAMMTASVSAQKTTVTANKTWDNWYIGFKYRFQCRCCYSYEQIQFHWWY